MQQQQQSSSVPFSFQQQQLPPQQQISLNYSPSPYGASALPVPSSSVAFTNNSNAFSTPQLQQIPQMQQQQQLSDPSSVNYNSFGNLSNNLAYASPYSMPPVQTYGGYGSFGGFGGGSEFVRRIPQQGEKKEDSVVAVIVTFHPGSSYDSLFRTVPQLAPEGRVSVFEVSNSLVGVIHHALCEEERKELDSEQEAVLAQILEDVKAVEPDAVVMNFECSGGCNEQGFCSLDKEVFAFTKAMLDRKHMVMFSDFSLKGLIGQWSNFEDLLGPKPVLQIDTFSNSCELRFQPSTLLECPSEQLKKVGELCEEGLAVVHAMGGTIMYTVDPDRKKDHDLYTLEVLTVMTKADGTLLKGKDKAVTLGEHQGAAGHVVLKYKSGGVLLLSAGHWMELSQLATSEETVFRVAEKSYGTAYAQQLKAQYTAAAPQAQAQMVQQFASNFVQSSAPCKYSSKGGF
ncbi:hypothetical protein QOT17_013888 [Balamuthia mandrillaris]